ncbi:hypothetical protein DL96DRAFT_1595636 [Flagelloscypha sp. PMI_526]|nr:hypothetical protein DL96DRAFT_1595636 [Flagelloscypha sp. PMI_526]
MLPPNEILELILCHIKDSGTLKSLCLAHSIFLPHCQPRLFAAGLTFDKRRKPLAFLELLEDYPSASLALIPHIRRLTLVNPTKSMYRLGEVIALLIFLKELVLGPDKERFEWSWYSEDPVHYDVLTAVKDNAPPLDRLVLRDVANTTTVFALLLTPATQIPEIAFRHTRHVLEEFTSRLPDHVVSVTWDDLRLPYHWLNRRWNMNRYLSSNTLRSVRIVNLENWAKGSECSGLFEQLSRIEDLILESRHEDMYSAYSQNSHSLFGWVDLTHIPNWAPLRRTTFIFNNLGKFWSRQDLWVHPGWERLDQWFSKRLLFEGLEIQFLGELFFRGGGRTSRDEVPTLEQPDVVLSQRFPRLDSIRKLTVFEE